MAEKCQWVVRTVHSKHVRDPVYSTLLEQSDDSKSHWELGAIFAQAMRNINTAGAKLLAPHADHHGHTCPCVAPSGVGRVLSQSHPLLATTTCEVSQISFSVLALLDASFTHN